MLLVLKAELIRRGKSPVKALAQALGCSEQTARNKINGRSQLTVHEAVEIQRKYFNAEGYSIAWLFENSGKNGEPLSAAERGESL